MTFSLQFEEPASRGLLVHYLNCIPRVNQPLGECWGNEFTFNLKTTYDGTYLSTNVDLRGTLTVHQAAGFPHIPGDPTNTEFRYLDGNGNQRLHHNFMVTCR